MVYVGNFDQPPPHTFFSSKHRRGGRASFEPKKRCFQGVLPFFLMQFSPFFSSLCQSSTYTFIYFFPYYLLTAPTSILHNMYPWFCFHDCIPGVAVLAVVPAITVHRVPPLIRALHRGTWGGPAYLNK